MARRFSKKSSEGLGMAILLIFRAIAAGVKAVFDFISNNIVLAFYHQNREKIHIGE